MPSPTPWSIKNGRIVDAAPAGGSEGVMACEHCWHRTNMVAPTAPVKDIFRCCLCREEKYVARKEPEWPLCGHGHPLIGESIDRLAREINALSHADAQRLLKVLEEKIG